MISIDLNSFLGGSEYAIGHYVAQVLGVEVLEGQIGMQFIFVIFRIGKPRKHVASLSCKHCKYTGDHLM